MGYDDNVRVTTKETGISTLPFTDNADSIVYIVDLNDRENRSEDLTTRRRWLVNNERYEFKDDQHLLVHKDIIDLHATDNRGGKSAVVGVRGVAPTSNDDISPCFPY